MVVIHGRQYSWLKPLHYSYIFITCDVVSLVIQAVGGGMTAIAAQEYNDVDPGTYTMIAGIAFQVFSMSVFYYVGLSFVGISISVTYQSTKQTKSIPKEIFNGIYQIVTKW